MMELFKVIAKILLFITGISIGGVAWVEWKKLGGDMGLDISFNTLIIGALYIILALHPGGEK